MKIVRKSAELPARFQPGPVTLAIKEHERQRVQNKFALGNSINFLRARGIKLPPTESEICGLANKITNRERIAAQPERRGTVWVAYVQEQLRARYPELRIRVTLHAKVWHAKVAGAVKMDVKFQGRHDPIAFLSEMIDFASNCDNIPITGDNGASPFGKPL